jgi:hypothetical protein
MRNKTLLISAMLFAFVILATPVKFAIEDVHQRFYQSQGFIMSEQLEFSDESESLGYAEATEEKTRMIPAEGLLRDAKGELVNFDYAIFVLNAEGHLFSGHNIPGVHHSYLYKEGGFGKDVAMAGDLSVKNGKITYISNTSGHYQPNRDQLVLALHYLHKLGVLDPAVTINVAGEFLQPTLAQILSLDTQAILDRYPGPTKKADNYIEERQLADQTFRQKLIELEPDCPEIKNRAIQDLVADFKIPQALDRYDLGSIELGSRKWQIFLEQSWPELPQEVLNAKAQDFKFTDDVRAWDFRQTAPNGLVTRIGGCIYFLMHDPAPQKSFTFWLAPLAE